MEIRDSEMSLVFFILYICKMKKIMKGNSQNGSYTKKIQIEYGGETVISIPRDRND